MKKRTFSLFLVFVAGLATATPKQPQNTPALSIIQAEVLKLKKKFKSLKKYLNEDEDARADLGFSAVGLICIAYVFDKSITLGHELSHCIASWMTLNPSYFYISPKFRGGGYCSLLYSTPSRISHIFISAAGPLGGIITTFAWLKIYNIFTQQYIFTQNKKTKNEEFENFKKHCIKGWKKPLFNENSSLLATTIIFMSAFRECFKNMIPDEPILNNTHEQLSGTISKNDGLQILEKLPPTLAKAYQPFVYASLMGITGFGVYGLYKIIKAKYKAYQENKDVNWW